MPTKLQLAKKKTIEVESRFPWNESGFEIVYTTWETNVTDAGIETFSKFVGKFMKGYSNRPSTRTSNESATKPDVMVDVIIKARVPGLTKEQLRLIEFGHRLSMSAENIMGLILEEYIHENVISLGWACVWGNAITAVDFCSRDGKLLQIKNRSNTENSSSSKIRNGTKIQKWYRVNATTGETKWEALVAYVGAKTNSLSEKGFTEYTAKLIRRNPDALYMNQEGLPRLLKKG